MCEIFDEDLPDWHNAYAQVYSWQFLNSHKGLKVYYENLYDMSDYESIQHISIYLKKNGYEKIADRILCLTYKENELEDTNNIEMYKEVSEWI